MPNFKAINTKSFSSTEAVRAYSVRYLRSSEDYIIKKYMPKGVRVLDVGCGTGRTTNYIYKHGCWVTGIDIAPLLVKKAKEFYPEIDFEIMDAAKLLFPDAVFDVVFFSFNGLDNLGSLADRHGAIKELMRVVKSGGYFIYSSHNSLALPRTIIGYSCLLKNLFKCRIGPHWRKEEHGFGPLFQYYNNVWDERRQLKQLGFKLVEVVTGNKITCLPTFVRPLLEKFPLYVIKK